ncbi:MAG: nitroreductase/quinone reductase family protein [Candidatus Limnocylindria bacterium]
MSVTVPPKGTRGVPFPRFITRLFSRFVPGMFRRRPNTTSGGIPTLLLETRGGKTGKLRYAMLGFLEDGPSAWLVIASAIGAKANPAWLHNLAKEPRATIEFFGGRRVEVEAETLVGAELDAAWKRLEVEAPEYPRYLSKTDRQIPVIRLRERSRAR